MIVSKQGIDFIKSFEGLQLTAYQDQAGIWTIGYGTIIYQDGTKVKAGDSISIRKAEDLLTWQISLKAAAISGLLKQKINQNQFDALSSLAYNIGVAAFSGSTVLKLVNADPSNAEIGKAFLMWDKIRLNGKLIKSAGLITRRQKEYELYSLPMNSL